MPRIRALQRAFSGGVISPALWGHFEDKKYQTGGATYVNMVPVPQGRLDFRPGTFYVNETKDSTKQSALIAFAAGASTSYMVGIEEGAFRFYYDGAPVLFATSRHVASIDSGAANSITFDSAHGFTSNQLVRLVRPAASTTPGGLSTTVDVYVIVVNTLTIQVSASTGPGAAIDITTAGSGDLYFFAQSELPDDYVASKNVSGVDTGAETVTITSHGLATGDPIQFTVSGGTIIQSTPAIVADAVVYARYSDANKITIHPTEADALAGTNAYNITGAGTGTSRMHFAYTQGDLVNYPNAGVYYCETDYPQDNAPGTSVWHLLPFTGEYEIPNPYVEADIPYIQPRRSHNLMRLAHPSGPMQDLVRESDTRWRLTEVDLAPAIDAPGTPTVTPTYGVYYEVQSNNGGAGTYFYLRRTGSGGTPSVPAHSFATGDVLWISLNADGTGALDGNSAGAYSAEYVSAADFRISTLAGARISFTGSVTGYARYVGGEWDQTTKYVVTAVRVNGSESVASAEGTATINLAVEGAYNTITWSAVSGAARYRVYQVVSGLAGFLAETVETTFKHTIALAPDFNYTPPRFDTALDTAYPGVIASFEQRDVLAGLTDDPQRIIFTALLNSDSLTYHIPLIDTDRISYVIESPEAAAIRHIVPLQNLVVLTESTEFVMTTIDSDAITPFSFRTRAASYVGSSHVKPALVHDKLIFCANRGGHVFEFSLKGSVEGYRPVDLCLRAPHLFDGYTIVDMAFQKAPYHILWCVRSDGALLGFTYSPEEEVSGWHLHTTDGEFEAIAVAAEGTEDRIYVVVKRTIDGQTVRYVERFDTFAVKTLPNAFHVDCGATYSGASATTISGLDHLEGEEVSANSNGTAVHELEVTDGAVTLSTATTIAQIGLPFEGEWQSLPVASGADAALTQGRTKNPARGAFRITDTATFLAGSSDVDGELTEVGTDGELTTGEEAIRLPNDWTEAGQIRIKQPDPLPLHLVSMSVDFEIGGS